MKLDRNKNPDGRGKYALVNMRKMGALLDRKFDSSIPDDVRDEFAVAAFNLLVSKGIITLGNESPGDQFFVMKYKDIFTAPALRAYAEAISRHIRGCARTTREINLQSELNEYRHQIRAEAAAAERVGNQTPD